MSRKIPKGVSYSVENGIFTLEGNSTLEDANDFYFPLFDRLDNIIMSGRDLEFHFKLDYYNTISARYITFILYKLEALSKMAKVKVLWFYSEDDEDIYELGQEYKETKIIPIKLVEIKLDAM